MTSNDVPYGSGSPASGKRRNVVRRRDERPAHRNGAIVVAMLVAAQIGVAPVPAASPEWASPSTAATVAHDLEVVPGGMVRWVGQDIESCRLGDRSWLPHEGACWIPIDLLQAPGLVDVTRTRRGVVETAVLRIGDYPYPTQRLTVAPGMASPPDSQLDRIRRESDRVSALWSVGGPPRFELPLSPPLDPLPEARSFGSRRLFNGESRDPHSGIDLSAPAGTPVHAAAAGRVVIAADHYFSGRSVFIDHGDDLVTMYFHLDSIDVREGDSVERGQVIGSVGATGRVTGPHLHFGLRWHGARIDPALLLAGSDGVVEIETTTRD